MIRLVNMALGAALLAAAAGSAYAQELQPQGGALQVPQVSALPVTPKMEPKPSGGSNTESTHFIKPPGYDQNRSNYPYGKGSGPKPS
jgi:hypothetical protein